jgi:hypothetical protein
MKLPAAYATEITDEGEDGIVIRQDDEQSVQTDMGAVTIHLTDEQARAIAKEIMRILDARKADA